MIDPGSREKGPLHEAGSGSATVDRALARDTFAALARCYVAGCRACAGPGVTTGVHGWVAYGAIGSAIPDLNRAMTADAERLPPDDVIAAVLADLAAYPAMSWWIPPGPRQAAIEARLAAEGLAVDPHDPLAPAMVLELATAPLLGSMLAAVPGLEIEQARTPEAVHAATMVSAAGFEMPEELGAELAAVTMRMGRDPDGPARYFVARLDGRPVAAAFGCLDRDAVGIYNVGTIPDARGRGIGGALTLAVALDGQDRGARIAVLEASRMGRPVYRRIGFRDAGESRVVSRRVSPPAAQPAGT